jgi:hypothetical protein
MNLTPKARKAGFAKMQETMDKLPLQRLRRRYMQRPALKVGIDADPLTALSLAVREAAAVRAVCKEMGIKGPRVETGIVAMVDKKGRFFSVPDDGIEQSDLLKRLVQLPDWTCVGLIVTVATEGEYVRWPKALAPGPEAAMILNIALYGQIEEPAEVGKEKRTGKPGAFAS